MHRRALGFLLVCLVPGLLAGCGAATPSQSEIQATIAAGIAATSAAQHTAQSSASVPTVAPATTPTAAADAAPTAAPFAPAATAAAPTAATAETDIATASAATSTAGSSAAGESASSQAAPNDAPTTFEPASAGAAAPTINIELVFDSSGSMAEKIGNETKIEAARRAIQKTIDQLPDNAPNFNVGFRVFGHKGNNTDAGKAESCASTDLYVPLQGVNKDALRQQAAAYEPTGWTPISLALQKAGEDLKAGENTKNVIIMVTDGEETCNGDPCAVSQALAQSGAEVRIDVVGFGLTPDVAKNLKCIPDNSGGTYNDAQNGDALVSTLQQLVGGAVKRSYLRIIAFDANGQRLKDTVDLISLKNEQGQAVPFDIDARATLSQGYPLAEDGEQLLQLEPGTYSFVIKQNRGYDGSFLNAPAVNVERTYLAKVAEGQETVATVGIGALDLESDGAPPEYSCDLAIQAAVDGTWQAAYDAGGAACARTNEQLVGGGIGFGIKYLFQPGRYRVVDTKRDRVIADTFVLDAGKTVTLRVKGNS